MKKRMRCSRISKIVQLIDKRKEVPKPLLEGRLTDKERKKIILGLLISTKKKNRKIAEKIISLFKEDKKLLKSIFEAGVAGIEEYLKSKEKEKKKEILKIVIAAIESLKNAGSDDAYTLKELMETALLVDSL